MIQVDSHLDFEFDINTTQYSWTPLSVEEARNMFKGYKTLICIMVGVSLASCYCPVDKMIAYGRCSLRITCIGAIHGIELPKECLEATNDPVDVQVYLTNAIETFDNVNIDNGFLNVITKLKITANRQKPNLAMLQYTSRLKTLHLSDTGLEKIEGTPFFYLSHLEELDLSHNKITEIDDMNFQFESQPNVLKNLSLAYNAIETLSSLAFEKLTSLIELDLSYNIISDLTKEPFFNLTQLKVLRLNNNRIKDLNGALNKLQNLKHLYVRGNEIENIDDESLQIIEHLITFDLSSNKLDQIKPIMFLRHWAHFGNHSICKIILSENHIALVPNDTANEISSRYTADMDMSSVDIFTELDLSMNSITNVEYNAFQSLIRVVDLNLSKNKLIDFIVNANDLAHVTCLNLSSNYISHLYYESFSKMNNLQHLDLSYNRVDFIPDMAFNNNNNLKLVNMTFNEIEKLESIHITIFHPEGGVLDLSNNALFKLNVPYGEALRLITLYLRSNDISNVTLIDLSQQRDLKILDMSDNKIGDLDITSLLLPSSLWSLDLSYNKIQQIGPSTFHKFCHLRTLRLGRNYLTQLDYGVFRGLASLQNLDLSYNRLTYLDSKMLTDLKSLKVLSVRSNDMNVLDYKSWFSHKYEILVYIDNNNLTCEWLSKAVSDFNNGYSRMRPTVLVSTNTKKSVEGIPCMPDDANALVASSRYVAGDAMQDERLLVLSQRILEGIREENYYLRKIMWHILLEDKEKLSKV